MPSKMFTPTKIQTKTQTKNRFTALAESDNEDLEDKSTSVAPKSVTPVSAAAAAAVAAVAAVLRVPTAPVKVRPAFLEPRPVSPPPRVATVALEADPCFAAMLRGDMAWGDIILASEAGLPIPEVEVYVPTTPPPATPVATEFRRWDAEVAVAAAEAEAEEEEEPLIYDIPEPRRTEADFWDQPWAAGVHEHAYGHYSTAALSDPDWQACMRWIHAGGWAIDSWDRKEFTAFAANGPAVTWMPPRPKTSAVPRFCQGGDKCKGADVCRYVHGNTIPRVNEPCRFGDTCSKREACLHMHPGETWTEGMVITRPAASVAPAADVCACHH
jgi:hypothetical protein